MHQIISWGQSSCRIKAYIHLFAKAQYSSKAVYTERERELFSAIETYKEYKNILLCYPIIVFTDHKNNIFIGLKASDRVLPWLLLLEEYGVTFEHLPGKKNIVADAFLCLDIDSLKIQKEIEKSFTLLSGSENNSISNIK
jgi:hypothetical protein